MAYFASEVVFLAGLFPALWVQHNIINVMKQTPNLGGGGGFNVAPPRPLASSTKEAQQIDVPPVRVFRNATAEQVSQAADHVFAAHGEVLRKLV